MKTVVSLYDKEGQWLNEYTVDELVVANGATDLSGMRNVQFSVKSVLLLNLDFVSFVLITTDVDEDSEIQEAKDATESEQQSS